MAEEFKFNEKTGMYEIVKKDKSKDKQESNNKSDDRFSTDRDYNTVDRYASNHDSQPTINKTIHEKVDSQPRNGSQQSTHSENSKINKESTNNNYSSDYYTSSHSHPYNTPRSEYEQEASHSSSHQGQSQDHPYHSQKRPKSGLEDLLDNEQTMGTLVWVGTIGAAFLLNIFFIIVPLVFYLLYEKKSAFVRSHSREALNVSISVIIYGLGLSIVTAIFSSLLMVMRPFFLSGLISSILVLVGVGIYGLVVGIQGAMAANRNQTYIPPFTIRFLK